MTVPGRGERILTTHAGSLPRPQSLIPLLLAQDRGESVADGVLEAEVRAAVGDVVRSQLDAGVDVIDDGEVSKPGFESYVNARLAGFGGQGTVEDTGAVADLEAFPDFAALAAEIDDTQGQLVHTACNGPVAYVGQPALRADIENLKAALGDDVPAGTFMSAASPGVITDFSPNQHYASHEEYLKAVADAMREEYEAIHEAGFVVQLDCPDFAFSGAGIESIDAFRRQLAMSVEALNEALVDVPAEAARIHVCWGNGEFPRTSDVELRSIIDLIFQAKPAGIMLMGANGRHAHEWATFRDVKLPDGKYVLPGVIDSTSNIVEHPEVVAQRLEQWASVVGRDNVMASTDCGFATVAGMKMVVPSVVWAKLRSMAEGARIASERLWT